MRSELDVMVPDMDGDQLTDSQEEYGVINAVALNFFINRSSKKANNWDKTAETGAHPLDNDTDGDGANDGFETNPPDESVMVDSGSNPDASDVVQVLILRDNEFTATKPNDEKFIRKKFREVNKHFKTQFGGREPIPQFTLTEKSKWLDWDTESSFTSCQDAETDLEIHTLTGLDQSWPADDDRGADIAVGWTGRRVGNDVWSELKEEYGTDSELKDIVNSVAGEWGDGCVSDNRPIVIMGTNDLMESTWFSKSDNLLQHELGHVFGAPHPSSPVLGNMCKYRCFYHTSDDLSLQPVEMGPVEVATLTFQSGLAENIWTTHKFSDESKQKMIELTRFQNDVGYRQSIKAISSR